MHTGMDHAELQHHLKLTLDRLMNLKRAGEAILADGRLSDAGEYAIHQWANPDKGYVKAPAPRSVVLRTVNLHGVRYTLPEWVEEFVEEALALEGEAYAIIKGAAASKGRQPRGAFGGKRP